MFRQGLPCGSRFFRLSPKPSLRGENTMKKTLIASLVALTVSALPDFVDAAGLGRLHVYSALGQPLQAEIDLSASAEELQSLAAKIASPEAFIAANVSYSPLIPRLQVGVQKRGDRHVVRITSDVPVSEPFMDLVVELNWASGRLVREYIFLLDPAEVKTEAVSAPVTPPAAAPRPAANAARPPAPSPAANATRPQAPSPAPNATRPQAPSPAVTPGSHTVARGDTLNRVASRNRPENVTLDQMLVALFKTNPDAFDGNNMNRLRSGRILNMPDEEALQSLTQAQARTEVLAHARDFNRYRQRMAASVPPARSPDEEAMSGMSGRITPKVEEENQRRGDAPRDQLQISRTQTGDTAKGTEGEDPLARMQALEDDIFAREKALDEAHARLTELEETVRELQALVELRNQMLAQMQQSAQTLQVPTPLPAETPPVASPPPASETLPKSEPPPVAAEPAPPPAQAVEAPPKPKPLPVAPPPAPPVEEEGFLASLLSNPMMLGAGGGIVLLLLGYLAYLQRKKKAEEEETGTTEAAPLGGALGAQEPVDTPQALVVKTGSGGGQVDTGSESSIMDSNFGHTSIAMIGEEEGVDPVAEADVYIAYGRDAEAERILVDALQAHGDRPAIHLKLMSIYASRGDLPKFEGVASQLYTLTGGNGEDWQKAAQLGRELDPTNPLYAAPEGGSESPVPTTNDMDLSSSGFDLPEDTQMVMPMEAGRSSNLEFDLPPDFEPGSESLDLSDISEEDPASKGLEFDFSVPFGTETEQLASSSDLPMDEGLPQVSVTEDDQKGRLPNAEEKRAADEADNGLDFDFDLPEIGGQPESAATAPETKAPGSEGFDSTALEFELNIDEPIPNPASTLDLSEPVRTTAPNTDDFDFGDIQLDMDPTTPTLSTVDNDALDDLPSLDEPVLEAETPSFDEPTGADDIGSPEVDTKLELAEAYEEMGDKEGARELLNEVLAEGSEGQKEKARAMIEKLG
jgi:pilus assembly protein FimV